MKRILCIEIKGQTFVGLFKSVSLAGIKHDILEYAFGIILMGTKLQAYTLRRLK